MILKIVENFLNLMKKLNPQEICSAQIYICVYILPCLNYIPYYFQEIQRQKKARHPHPHPHPHQNKTKVFGVESEILIKYKRIKWTPSCKASHLLPEGKFK